MKKNMGLFTSPTCLGSLKNALDERFELVKTPPLKKNHKLLVFLTFLRYNIL
jgi:hypothetical protein